MGKDIPLGRIAGIKVGMNPTVLLLAGLYAWTLAAERIGSDHTGLLRAAQPGHIGRTYWIAGALGALLIFVSLLVHEVGHALVARDEGIGVRSMGLTMLGGVTRMESSPETAGAEFRVSVVGPLGSAAFGVALLCIAYVTPDTGVGGLSGEVLAWAGRLNLLLAAFNLIPATPLDGGKVLSSILWHRTGSQATAMTWSARAGIAVGGGLVGFGLWQLRRGAELGLWLAIVGGFILLSAIREHQVAPLYGALSEVTVAETMSPAPPAAAEWSTIADFLRMTNPGPDQQAFPVVGADGRITGLLTAHAIRAVPPHQWESLQVGSLAFPVSRLTRLSPGEAVLPAVQKIEAGDVRIGIVTDAEGRVVGTLDNRVVNQVADRRRAGLGAGR
jgi:Zn-dependent protease